MQAGLTHRPPRLYGRRRARSLRPARRALMENLLPRIRVDLPDPPTTLDTGGLFGPQARQVWLEVGFGKGEHLVWQAAQNPDVGLIGCEPYIDGVAAVLSAVEDANQGNIRIYPDDAATLIGALAPNSVSRVFILFPDPWPKKKHHKRRFVSDRHLDMLAEVMQDGAELRFATDHPDYCRWTLKHLSRRKDFEWSAERPSDWRFRPDDWPPTRYEEKALRGGARCVYLSYRRLPRVAGY